MAFREVSSRSIAKTVTYRIVIVVSNFIVAYILTGSTSIASQVAGLTFVINTAIYFFHERAWDSVRWGKTK